MSLEFKRPNSTLPEARWADRENCFLSGENILLLSHDCSKAGSQLMSTMPIDYIV
jgi:hypothetical protein